MKGLLIKDFKYIIKHHLGFLFVAALFFCMAVFSNGSMYFSYYSVAMISLMPVFTMAYDEAYKWSWYEAILPVKKHLIVLEKYILVFIAAIPAIIIEALIFNFYRKMGLENLTNLAYMMLFVSLVSPAVVLPLNFRFGYLKGKIVNIIVMAIMAGLITTININTNTAELAADGNFAVQQNAFIFAILGVVIISISAALSIILYKKREF